MRKSHTRTAVNPDDFAVTSRETKHAAKLVRILVREFNRHHLEWATLRYIYRETMKRTGMTIPKKERKLYDLVTPAELDRFLGCIQDEQEKLAFTILISTGMRVGELVSIKVVDFTFESGTVKVMGKGRKERIIPLSARSLDRVKLFLHGKRNKWLLESRLGRPYSTRRIEQLCHKYKEMSGITKKLTPHHLRHYFNSKLSEIGVQPEIRALICGHDSLASQRIYSHAGLDGCLPLIREAYEKLELNNTFK